MPLELRNISLHLAAQRAGLEESGRIREDRHEPHTAEGTVDPKLTTDQAFDTLWEWGKIIHLPAKPDELLLSRGKPIRGGIGLGSIPLQYGP